MGISPGNPWQGCWQASLLGTWEATHPGSQQGSNPGSQQGGKPGSRVASPAKDRANRRSYHLRKYGLTHDAFEGMLKGQGHTRPICAVPFQLDDFKGPKGPVVDHCHATGKARPEDRKLLAEFSGLSAGDQVNVNIAVDNTGFLGRRWSVVVKAPRTAPPSAISRIVRPLDNQSSRKSPF